jgi:hypothetical protein
VEREGRWRKEVSVRREGGQRRKRGSDADESTFQGCGVPSQSLSFKVTRLLHWAEYLGTNILLFVRSVWLDLRKSKGNKLFPEDEGCHGMKSGGEPDVRISLIRLTPTGRPLGRDTFLPWTAQALKSMQPSNLLRP